MSGIKFNNINNLNCHKNLKYIFNSILNYENEELSLDEIKQLISEIN